MRTLKFIVDGENLKQDPSCDFSGLFPCKNPQVRAEFVFSHEWKTRAKVVAFWSMVNKEYPPRTLNSDNVCEIPEEALSRPAFKIQILGRQRGRKYETNTITVYQKGGKV